MDSRGLEYTTWEEIDRWAADPERVPEPAWDSLEQCEEGYRRMGSKRKTRRRRAKPESHPQIFIGGGLRERVAESGVRPEPTLPVNREEQRYKDFWSWEMILDGRGPWAQPGEYRRPKEELEAAKAERRCGESRIPSQWRSGESRIPSQWRSGESRIPSQWRSGESRIPSQWRSGESRIPSQWRSGSPESLPSGGVGSPESLPSGGVGSPESLPSGGVGSPESLPSGGVGSPESLTSGGVGSPESLPSGGVGSPETLPSGGVGSPETLLSGGVGSPETLLSGGVGSPETLLSGGVGSPETLPSGGVGSPETLLSGEVKLRVVRSARYDVEDTDEYYCEYDSTWEDPPNKETSRQKSQHERVHQYTGWSQQSHRLNRFKSAAKDMQKYRHDYPEHRSNLFFGWQQQEDMPNLQFYREQIPSSPDGVFIEDFHKKWNRQYLKLERVHSYIQWLFPLQEPGMNNQAKELTKKEIEAFLQDETAKKRLVKSYKLMLDFYGIQLSNDSTGEVRRANNWRDRFDNLDRHTHNNLRITRILKCLGTLGFTHYQAPLVHFFLEETLVKGNLYNVKESVLNYFIFAVIDKQQRRELVKYAYKHYEPKHEFVWCPKKIQMIFSNGEELSDSRQTKQWQAITSMVTT
ncbi:uncharacterized protein LOC115143353 [Oncorhynchus nerka]|uniref:uncharacterized protein LOC115143353 n=1 Tax=Oncorhynchus nerka TaxID=8023 RepID=UPI0031B887B1